MQSDFLKHIGKSGQWEAFMMQFMDQLPFYAFILDQEQRIVFTNEYCLHNNEIKEFGQVFGKGPGDVFQCENAEYAGCGNSPNCKFCGLFKIVADCRKNGLAVSNVSKLMVNRNKLVKAYEFAARCAPISIGDRCYYFLTLSDISSENRKRGLERIFFHDVLNLINGLKGISYLIGKTEEQLKKEKYISMVSDISENLSEIISAQADLMNAEKGDLSVVAKELSSLELLQELSDSPIFNVGENNCTIIVDEKASDFTFISDKALLSRVLINILKNAVEAPKFKPEINIGAFKRDNKACFYVHNFSYINESDAKYIFQPMFSTKAVNRGLGAYSIRLICENYLKGKVWFTTDTDEGTVFTIEIPLNLEY